MRRVLESPGIRLSLGGGVLFLASMLALLVLPGNLCVVGMLIGGLAVWGGFGWTIFGYYTGGAGQDPPES